MVNRFEVYWVNLDPTKGSEIQKIRPCVVISPDEINHNLRTVIIAPITSTSKPYPTRIACQIQGRAGWMVLDQIRTVDQSRLGGLIQSLDVGTSQRVIEVLLELFA